MERPKAVTRQEFEKTLQWLVNQLRTQFDSGKTSVSFQERRAVIADTPAEDVHRKVQPGSMEMTITMRNPDETRPETWVNP